MLLVFLGPLSIKLKKGQCDQPEPVKGYIDGRAKEHTLGCFSSSRLYNQEVKRAEKQASAS